MARTRVPLCFSFISADSSLHVGVCSIWKGREMLIGGNSCLGELIFPRMEKCLFRFGLSLTTTSITLLGFATQNASFAVVTPIWLAHHLSTSPTISSRETDDLAIDLHKLASIPLSIIGGFVIPSFVLSLLVPKIVSSETKQIFIAVWQYFPFAIGLFQQILPGIMSNAFGIASQSSASGKKISPQSLPALRAVYCTFLIFAGISHIATITLVTTSQLFPMLFSPQCKGVFNFTKMFKPAGITGFTNMAALHPGMHQLLQYDFTVGAAAMVIWATTLWLKTGRKELSFLRSGGFFIGLMVLLGPIGAATASVWLRDEAIFAETVKRSKKES